MVAGRAMVRMQAEILEKWVMEEIAVSRVLVMAGIADRAVELANTKEAEEIHW